MKVSREQAAANRRRIVEVAGRLFRERGLDGIGVADLMKGAGLTHGGFYGHFGSKDALAAEACGTALAGAAARWAAIAARQPDRPFAAIVRSYLSERHRADPGNGCALPALGADAARHGGAVAHAFTDGLRALLDVLAAAAPGDGDAERRSHALAALSGMVGALLLARAVDDPALSEEILAVARAALGAEAPAP